MEQTIIEDSRLIAEYIGGRQEEHGDYEMYGIIESIDDGPDEKHFFLPSEMLFLSSWDWLMPVIRKIIKDIGVKTIDECTPEEWFQNTRICQMYIGIDIELAFYYVVEYIKWYNKNKLG